MADTSPTKLRTSKRKRAQVNYYEEPASDDEEVTLNDEESKEIEERSRAKKHKAVSSKPFPKKKIFPFLELPGELRNKIYGYCLQDPAGIYLFSTTHKFRRTVCRTSELAYRGDPSFSRSSDDETEDENGNKAEPETPSNIVRAFVPALLAVCKKINEEARSILYDHVFHVKDTMALHSFLVDLGPRAATYLKSIDLAEWGHGRGVHKAYNHACFTALATASNLQDFTYHGMLSCSSTPKAGATMFYRDAFPWLEAVGVTKGKADAAVDLVHVQVPEHGIGNYYWHRRHRWGKPTYKPYGPMDEFRKELAKLLNARMDRIRS